MSRFYNTRSRSGSGESGDIPSSTADVLVRNLPDIHLLEVIDQDDSPPRPPQQVFGTDLAGLSISQAIDYFRELTETEEDKRDICPVCSVVCSGTDEAICCDECDKWYHRACMEISGPVYNQLRQNSTKWYCNACKRQTNLPTYIPCDIPARLKLGDLRAGEVVTECNRIYDEVVRWKSNVFKLPSGAAGRSYLEEKTKVCASFMSGTALEAVSMTLFMIMPALLLQKPSKRSKAAEHTEVDVAGWQPP